MKRQETLSQRDLELLNAYLDDALNEKEKQRFEARLARSLQLQKKLKEYTQLKVALRELPKQPAPRNFTLSQEQARAYKPGPKLYPAFSYVALTAVLLLAIIFSSEFFFNQFATPMAAQMESPTMEAESFAVKSAEEEPEPLIFTWGYPGIGGMGGGAEGGFSYGINIMIAPTPEEQIDTTVSGEEAETPPEEGGIPTETPEWGMGGGSEETYPLEATPTPTTPAPETVPETPRVTAVEPLILGLQADKVGKVIATYPQFPDETASQAEPARMWRNLVSADVKIALAAAAALFGILALVLYIKR